MKTGTQCGRRRFARRQPELPDQDDAFTAPPVMKPKVPNGLALPGEAIRFKGTLLRLAAKAAEVVAFREDLTWTMT